MQADSMTFHSFWMGRAVARPAARMVGAGQEEAGLGGMAMTTMQGRQHTVETCQGRAVMLLGRACSLSAGCFPPSTADPLYCGHIIPLAPAAGPERWFLGLAPRVPSLRNLQAPICTAGPTGTWLFLATRCSGLRVKNGATPGSADGCASAATPPASAGLHASAPPRMPTVRHRRHVPPPSSPLRQRTPALAAVPPAPSRCRRATRPAGARPAAAAAR
eukprot:352318-Chlamydomonas_euryale.AAC.1